MRERDGERGEESKSKKKMKKQREGVGGATVECEVYRSAEL